jgi:predicted nucleotidyltransferase
MTENFLERKAFWKVFRFLSAHPSQEIHLRHLARESGLTIRPAHEIVHIMINKGFLFSRTIGNMKMLALNLDNPLVRQTRVMEVILSLEGLLKRLTPIARNIILFGSASEGRQTEESDVDLFIISKHLRETLTVVRKYSNEYKGREINAVVKDPAEVAEMKASKSPLWTRVERGITLFAENEEWDAA